jgi:processive 1,2-diacylglycerol beta-glucosyltransferase
MAAGNIKRVLVLSASVGAGHVRAAQAVERAFRESKAVDEVRHIDTLDYTNKLFRKLYSQVYIDLVNKAPDVLGWLYDSLDKPWRHERRRLALDRLNTVPFVKMLKEYQPDIAVCTHFLPAEIISWLKAKRKLNTPQAIVVTDFDVHAMWLCRHYEQYFVALDETRVHMAELGVPAEKIAVTGIPIDPVFAEPKDKREMRARHGLRPDEPTLLISAGGFGVGPIEHLMVSLMKLQHPAQVVAICGRSAELKERVERVVAKADGSRVAVKVVGFTTEMDEYMTAADMVVGKPGGLTTSEALAKGLVFVIVNPIPGQEERNADHLLEEGAAIRCNNLPVLAYKIDRLLDDPARFREMQSAARRLGKPNAARDIVTRMLTLA